MRIQDYGKFRLLFSGMITVALILSVVGMLDIPSTPYSGYRTSPDYKVIRIAPNSPAVLAGLREGDSIIEIGGLSTENLHQLAQQTRAKIGEEQKLVILREKMRHEFTLRLTSLPEKDQVLVWGGDLMALVMLGLGWWVYWKRANKVSALFFLCNFSFALSFMAPPYLGSFLMRNLVAVNSLLFLTLGFAFFLHLSVTFPKTKPLVAETGFVELLIYLPAPLLAISYLGLRLFEPRADLLVNLVLHNIFAILVLACLVLAFAAIIHSYWKATRWERSKGLHLVLLGSILGVIPPTAGFLLETFVPQFVLPGWEYCFLFSMLASFAFGWAIWKTYSPQEVGGLRHAA